MDGRHRLKEKCFHSSGSLPTAADITALQQLPFVLRHRASHVRQWAATFIPRCLDLVFPHHFTGLGPLRTCWLDSARSPGSALTFHWPAALAVVLILRSRQLSVGASKVTTFTHTSQITHRGIADFQLEVCCVFKQWEGQQQEAVPLSMSDNACYQQL